MALCACGGDNENQYESAPSPQKHDAPSGPIIFIGDSITARWNLQAFGPDSINAGIGGQTSCEMLARMETDVLSKHPDKVVILAGINDISIEPDANPRCVLEMAQRALASGASVIVGTLLPDFDWTGSQAIDSDEQGMAAIDAFNAEIRAGAASFGYTIADFYRAFLLKGNQRHELFVDGVHPNAYGYAFMQSIVQALLQTK